MLNNITWQGYWTILALLSAGYYLVIYFLYYRKDFKIENPKRGASTKHATTSAAMASFMQAHNAAVPMNEQDVVDFGAPDEKAEQIVYACMDELNAFLEGVKSAKCAKPEFLYAVQKILSKFPDLKNSQFKDSISQVILSEAAHHCSIHLSEEDMVHVWLEK